MRPGAWRVCCEFADLFDAVPQPLRPDLPSFRHALVDLGQMEDNELSGQARLRAFLKALKYSRRPDLPQRIDILLAEAPGLGRVTASTLARARQANEVPSTAMRYGDR
jgi:hypothetical protein